MGSHAYILNQKERWQVIQYVKVLMGDGPEESAEGTADVDIASK